MYAKPRVYYVLFVLGLAVALGGFRAQTRLAVLPADHPPPEVAYPVQVGEVAADTRAEVRFLAEGREPGSELALRDASGGEHRALLPRAHSPAYLLVTLASGLFFLGVAGLVFAPRVRGAAARDFFWCTLLYGIAVLIGGVYFPKDPPWVHAVGGAIQLACLAALPVLFVHLTLVFPRPHPALARRWLMPLLWSAAGAVLLWQLASFGRYFADPGPARWRALAPPQIAADALLVVQVVAGVLLLTLGLRRLEFTRERQQTKWLLWGFTIGVTPYVFLRTLPQLVGIDPPVGPAIDRVFELAIPVAFVLAVVRYRFLDIDIIIRRSLIYGILAGLLVAFYLVLSLAVGTRIEGLDRGWWWGGLVGTGLLAGLMFDPARGLIGRWVDRTFFKVSHDYGEAARGLGPDLQQAVGQEDVARLLVRFLGTTLRPQRAGVAVRRGGALHAAGDLDPAGAAAAMEGLAGAETPLAALNSTSLPERESGVFPPALAERGFVLAAPIRGDAGSEGCLLLGPRETERRFIEADLELVEGVAAEASVVLQRLRLVQTVDAEVLERRRLNELNRIKNDFFSQVAHDLRTPLASISWSTANLIDGVAGSLNEDQEEYLGSIKISSDSLTRMVNNLLEISRLERGVPDIVLERVDLAAVLGDALSTIRPLAEEKAVALRLEGETRDAPVRGNGAKLYEVALNLLDNAVKYSPPGSAVDVTIRLAAAGNREFSVRDRGPGLPPDEGEQLFERFKQSAASPYSQKHGFGLGLFIVRSYVELMGGSVAAANHPDGGAVFTCVLKEHPDAEASRT